MRVVITDHEFASVDAEEAAVRDNGAELVVGSTRDEQKVAELTAGADVVILAYAPITDRVLSGMAENATVIRYGVGYDTVDVEAATRRGVRVCNVPDYGAETVADHTVMLALATLRRAVPYDQRVREDEQGWIQAQQIGMIPALRDITYGLVGTGTIGLLVAERISAFGARILAYDPYAKEEALTDRDIERVELDDLLQRSDAISLHAPLTEETHHILDETALRRTQRGTILVNTARGALVDTSAAAALAKEGHLGGLGLDVFEKEPLPLDHPVREAPNTILTPHAAFYSTRALKNLQDYAAAEVGRALRGEPLRCQINR